MLPSSLIPHPSETGVTTTVRRQLIQLVLPFVFAAVPLLAAGLIAATADTSSVPTWMITGTYPAGVAAAAAAISPQALHDHFALAVSGAQRLPVPVEPAR